MTTRKAIDVLTNYNLWRRGYENIQIPAPWVITQALEVAIYEMKQSVQKKNLPKQKNFKKYLLFTKKMYICLTTNKNKSHDNKLHNA